MFRDILLVIDGWTHGDAAVANAIQQAAEGRARLTIMSVQRWSWLTPIGVPFAAPCPLPEEYGKCIAEEALAQALAQVPDWLPVTSILSGERLHSALPNRLRQHPHDLVILTARRWGRSPRLADIPVLVVDRSAVCRWQLPVSPVAT